MSPPFDRRITPARSDLAAAHLKGKVAAAAFVEGRRAGVARGVAGLRAAPSEDSELQTQLLFGEHFTVYEERDGWAWGQAALDSYVGNVRSRDLGPPLTPTHRVVALSTPLLSAPDVKRPVHDMLPMNAKLAVAEETGRFMRLANGLLVFVGHLAPLSAAAPDWVSVAARFLGVPYLWGGKTAFGLDCSGLIQTALEAGGVAAPRDTDMMEAALGEAIPLDSPLRRGDLVFWKGHVGVMLDGERLLHANAFAMEVGAEPLSRVRDRLLAMEGLAIRTIRRL